ncbi:aldo/keto reductase [Dietzia sp. 2505]|uniref:aldo/keto reductase n=1 Tax=Dietzia sp. 2505 TaxID=3156457 RepID=UPI0033977975
MTLTGGYGYMAPTDARDVLRHALDHEVALLDTSDAYPGGEELIARALAGRRDRPLVVTKCGLTGYPGHRVPCGRPEYLAHACAASRRRLEVETIDVVILHRIDPQVPVEESIGALADLRDRGLIAQIGISSSDVETIRRAAAVDKLAFVEAPLSVIAPGDTDHLIAAVREVGSTLLAYSPLGRGLAAPSQTGNYGIGDARAHIAEMREPARIKRAEALAALSAGSGLTMVALALGWLVSLGADVVPIPGARNRQQALQNLEAQRPLSPEIFAAVEAFTRRVSFS